MREFEFVAEALTSVGRRYQELYSQYYKRAHLHARKQGLVGREADQYAERALQRYKDRIRTGEYDPINNTKGRTEYKINETELDEMARIHWNTEPFKRWFSGSVLVNPDGTPKVWYHGSGADIETFCTYRTCMYYFSPRPDVANQYAQSSAESWDEAGNYDTDSYAFRTAGGASIYPVYLFAKNPFDPLNQEQCASVATEMCKRYNLKYEAALDEISIGEYEIIEDNIDSIIACGFDAVYVKEYPSTLPQDRDIAVFDQRQIKSAVGNRGEYGAQSIEISK